MTIFHTTEPPWFESVKDLKPGGKRRVADGKLASFNGRAYHLYDFREKDGEVWEPQLTLEQKLAIRRELLDAEEAAVQSNDPPEGMPHPQDWPVEARNWLHKAAVSNEGIQRMGAVWSARMRRVIVPLHLSNGSHSWMARDVGLTTGPKYLFPRGMQKDLGVILPSDPSVHPQTYVLTEDYLSGWRVSQDVPGSTAIALLGTSLDRDAGVKLVNNALSNGARILTWLDPDYWGQRGARVIRRQLAQYGLDVGNIVSEVDPKNLDRRDLRRFVEDAAWLQT